MRTMFPTSDLLNEALHLHALGLRLVPLAGKAAIVKNWPELRLRERDIRSWCACGVNWGIITGEPLIVLDTDSERAEAWVQANHIESPVMVRTGRGGLHRYFRYPDRAEIRSRTAIHRLQGLDLKGRRSYVVAPGSIHPVTGRQYAYLPGKTLRDLGDLPIFDPAWICDVAESAPVQPENRHPVRAMHGRIRHLGPYIRRIQSVQGQGGDRACFTVACLLAEAGLSFDELLRELEAWNQECARPTWSREDLAHKARLARARVLGKRIHSNPSPEERRLS